MRRLLRNEKGVTLIELLVAMSIAGIFGLVVVRVFEVNSQVFSGEQKVMHMHSQARQAMWEIAKNARLAGFDTSYISSNTFGLTDSAGGTSPITDSSSFYYTADLDEDKALNANEYFGYRLSVAGGRSYIEMQVRDAAGVTSWRVVAEDISASPAPANNPAFCIQYTFADGTQSTCDPGAAPLPDNAVANRAFDDIRMVTITITARTENVHNLTKQFHYETVSSTIMLRNITGS